MDLRAVYEVQVEAKIEGEHLDLVKDPETTATIIGGAVAEALPFFSIKNVKTKAKVRCRA